ncbi:hypothetical protein J4E89_010132 [Alternaria sp. Ai002NY15]|nr:hypothetical protein J4E89_010132 [Alternaria sp. Ai002NY15]
MADPFSITGSAVGVVSLAIQVCKGLEWYLSGVKEAKNKAEQITAETEQLANLLELLESTISKVDQSNSVSATRTGIVSCAHAIATTRKKLKPDGEVVNGGIKSSLKRLTKRLAFPFKESEIRYWKDVLNTVQQSLQTALSTLLIDQQRLAFEDVQARFMQLSMEQSAQHHASLQMQRNVFDATSLQLAGQSNMFESARELGKLRVYAIDDYVESRYELFTGTFLDLTLWVDRAANTLGLSRLIHDYIRLFVFSYLEIQHTCCDITRISRYRGNPDSSEQPYPRYPPTELRRITNEDAHLRARLEELVPELISQYDSFGGQLQDFVIDVLIPTMRRTAKELKEEDKTLYAAGRREMGVVMDEDEDETERESSEVDEEETDAEEESDDEY